MKIKRSNISYMTWVLLEVRKKPSAASWAYQKKNTGEILRQSRAANASQKIPLKNVVNRTH